MGKFTRTKARIGTSLLAAALTVSCMSPLSAFAVNVKTESQTQMSSNPEIVYTNAVNNAVKRSQNFDANWKFYLGDAGNAEGANFDDSKWRNVSLPHDYSIEQSYTKSGEAESGYLPGGTGWYRKHFTVADSLKGKELRIDFDGVYMNSTVYINGQKLGTHPYGYTPFSFDITDHVKFGEENVIAVKVDHKTPSSRWYSGSGIYRSVNLTITDPVSVALNGTKIETPELATNQTAVKTKIKTTVKNAGQTATNVTLKHTIFEKGNETKIGEVTTQGTEVAANTNATIEAELTATNPKLWSIENPNLYTVKTEVTVGDKVVDTYDTEYGFRFMEFDKDTGFKLNGKNVKLKGVCMHHDQGALGAVANRRAIERQVEILAEMGCNSIRVTHNPAAQHLIDICNEKGILVIEEIYDGWHHLKNGNTEDFSKYFNKAIGEGNSILGGTSTMTWAEFSLKSILQRDQNAPSVIMWSLGNEIQEGTDAGYTDYDEKVPDLINWAKAVDTTRPLTIGSNAVKNEHGNGEHTSVADKITAAGGVSGTNYSSGGSYDELHRVRPNWKLYGSETASSVNSRGVYSGYDKNQHPQKLPGQQLSSYDVSRVSWGALASEAWYDVITRDFVAGEYIWTGFDYIGEPTPWNGTTAGAEGTWPSPKNSFFGIIDTAGLPKDSYYLYQSQWNDKVNTLHVLPVWNENLLYKNSSNKVPVVVYSDAAKVKLELIKKDGSKVDLGTKEFVEKTTDAGYKYQVVKGQAENHEALYMVWEVPFAEGTLKATAYDKDGKEIKKTDGRSEVTTAGSAASLKVKADHEEIKADGKDLSYVSIDVVDAKGNIVPDAKNKVKVEVSGAGKLVGLDNGWQTDHDSYQADARRVYNGKGIAIIQSTKKAGDITVKFTADGLEGKTITLKTTAVEDDSNGKVDVESFFMSKNYYVKAGNLPQLPTEIETRFTDDTSKKLPVEWTNITADQVAKPNTFVIRGTVDGKYTVTATINVIDGVAALLNYSTTIQEGTKPKLPDSRQAVMANGEILDVAFPVKWNLEGVDFSKIGTIIVNGEANVFGQAVPVTASVRVQSGEVALGSSISGLASKLTQDIPEDKQSDTLEAINDGSTTISDNNQGGANPTGWSNWNNAVNHNDLDANITFEYDTQQIIGEVAVHFWRDNGACQFPAANTTEIYYQKNNGDEWTKLVATEEISGEKDRVKKYTYKFDTPISATLIKVKVQSAQGKCVGITEVDLLKATTTFAANSSAALSEMKVNDVALTAAELASKTYTTLATTAKVEAKSAENAAITVLPRYGKEVVVLTESEDHSKQDKYVINLGSGIVDEGITARAGSEYPGGGNEGPARLVIDNNPSTHWHTNYSTSDGSDASKRWIELVLNEATEVAAFQYLPRQNGGNGRVTEYSVQYSVNGQDYQEVAKGTWEQNDASWKTITFEQPINAKHFRLVGVHTNSDQGKDRHMAVSELRLVKQNVVDLADDKLVTIAPITDQNVAVVDKDHPVEPSPVVTSKTGEKLINGVDYVVTYENNTAAGKATAVVKGIGLYSGEVRVDFNIVVNEATLSTIIVKVKPKQMYNEGEKFNPAGLVLTLTYSDGSTKDVVYDDNNKADFTFAPTLDTVLATNNNKVTITYQNKSVDLDITVQAKTEDNVDKSKLDAFYDKVVLTEEGKYLPNTWEGFKTALDTAKGILDGTIAADQVAVDNAYDALVKAFLDLRLKPNKEALKELITKAEDLNNPKLAKAIAEAKAVVADENATEAQVKGAYATLEAAIKGLDAGDKVVANDDKVVANDDKVVANGDKAVATGDNNSVMIFATVAMASLLVLTLAIYRNKKENM